MTLLTNTADGVYAIAPTPFLPDGTVDETSIDRMVDFYAQAGCKGITILGVMGESQKLDPAEAMAIANQVLKRAAGKMQIVVGVSAPGFASMRNLTAKVMDAGAAGVMIAPVWSIKTEDQYLAYFRNAVEAIGADVPWVLQDYPMTTNVPASAATIRELIKELPSCVCIKHEDWPALEKITTWRKWEKEGTMRRTSILVGNGAWFLDMEMDRGVDGAMSGYCFTDMLVDVVNLSKAGKRDEAHDLFDAHLPLLRYEHQIGPGLASRKYVMAKRGIIAHDTQRKPGASLNAIAKEEVDYLLKRLARFDKRADV